MGGLSLITCLRFSAQLLICESVFLFDRSRRDRFPLRLSLALILYSLLALGWHTLLNLIPGFHVLALMAYYLGLLALSMVSISLCFDLPPVEILFVGTGGYAVEHITFAIVEMVRYFTGLTPDVVGTVVDNLVFRLIAYLLVSGFFYLVIIHPNRDKEEFREKDIRLALVSMLVLVFAVCLSVFYTSSRIAGNYSGILRYVICPAYSALSCALVLLLEYNVFRDNRLLRERDAMEQMLRMSDSQQKSAKEAIDIINMKCHDLKHQLRALAALNDPVERQEYMKEAQKAISIYDATVHTGCEPLDYVLREKMLVAEEHHVQFSCMADGKAIAFLSSPDIYALMGNALDNALESVQREPEEARLVSLNISRHGQMVVIHLENQCRRTVEFLDGLPQTDKEDKNFHGFGVRSIRYITEKYDGEQIMRLKDGVFSLDIIFPAQAED